MKIFIETLVNASFHEVHEGFNEDLFKSLKPPIMHLRVKRFDGCLKGDEVHLELGLGPVKQRWISIITEDKFENGKLFLFIDEGKVLPPPLRKWKHKHIVKCDPSGGTLIVDDIYYSSGFKLLDILLYPFLCGMFALRRPAYKRFFNHK